MTKVWKKAVIAILALVCCITLFTACMLEVGDKPIPLTDLANTYNGKIKDSSGNLLVPFDVAYPEAFASGQYKYDENALLLKMEKGTTSLSRNLKKCGFSSLEKITSAEDGDWFRVGIKQGNDIHTAIKKARSLNEVLIADYDYIYETEEFETEQTETDSSTGLIDGVLGNGQVKNQWYLKSSAIQESWRFLESEGISAGGASSVVVAVIDTGVDYMHPDLKANMWVNTKEIPGNGIDDDGNGYIDDVYGVNTVAEKTVPLDDHGHGTHVAGIIAAANNKEGIVGVAYNAKIMAVKAGQATGVFNQSDIAEGILYAYEMGADVINMSFGGSACSLAVQDALSTAYTRSTLVASAGNDGKPNEKTDKYKYPGEYLPNYPAALSYVIGVMSVDQNGRESGFSNWDANKFNAVEYEVYAPGEQILSTLPNGQYGVLSGTSMAAPIVSGAAALLRSYYTDRDMYPSKFISAQLSATSGDEVICYNPERHTVNSFVHNLPMRLNVYDALTKLPKPEVSLYEHYLFDDKSFAAENNGDGVIDAGELVEIGAVLRNRWGMSKNTIVTIDAIGDLGITNPYVQIITGSANFEGVGTYSMKDTLKRDEKGVVTGVDQPLVIRIAKNCPNDYLIKLNVTVTYENGLDESDRNTYTSEDMIEFWVRNGVVLSGQITEDQTWTKDNYYIIPGALYIAEGVTVTVEPGTKIQFWSNDPNDPYADKYIAKLSVAGKLLMNGSENEPIEIFPSEMMGEYIVEIVSELTGRVEMKYTNVINPVLTVDRIDHCFMTQNFESSLKYRYISSGKITSDQHRAEIKFAEIKESIFENITGGIYGGVNFEITSSQVENCMFSKCLLKHYNNSVYYNCVFQDCGRVGGRVSDFILEQKYKPVIENSYRIQTDPNSGHQYISINLASSSGDNYSRIQALAQAMGGDLACIETKQELDFLLSKSESFYGCLGLKCGDDKWINGESAADFLNIQNLEIISSSKDLYLFLSSSKSLCFNAPTYFIIEIKAENVRANTQEELQAIIDGIWKQGLAYRFSGNAILNNFNDENTDNWFHVQGAPRQQSKNYEPKINIQGNWWGTTDEFLIEKQIWDFDDYTDRADLDASNYLTVAPSNTFPFVTDAYLLNQNGERAKTVGNETVTFVVEFNRDMDVSVPLRVRFGSSEPYGEYEIEGGFVNARRWEGKYTLKTTIENGNQVINIENGRAADDHWLILCESAGRFQFEIDTTAAQAMIMQAQPTETGIKLTWMQDDFDTLAGYNVYRSDKEDGFYQRLNDYVLTVGTNEFFDSTVEPGKMYYYNFTVVKTDMSESNLSGKINVMSMDTMAPDIYHSPIRTAYTGSNLVVSATITDNLQITQAVLWYRSVGGEWKSTIMSANNTRYSGIIPAQDINLEGLEYYIAAFDGISYTYAGTEESPFRVIVKQAVDQNSLGDVDGDGTITTKDALMLLQAANDLLNLTEEQFLRADLNGDNELSAAEALRILQYVSGKITTITA